MGCAIMAQWVCRVVPPGVRAVTRKVSKLVVGKRFSLLASLPRLRHVFEREGGGGGLAQGLGIGGGGVC